MLKKRLIPVLVLREGNVVQSIRFQHTNVIHTYVPIAVEHFSKWAPDELVVVDVSPTLEKRQIFREAIRALARECFVPLSVGGWVDSIDEIRDLLKSGADKVVINTQAYRQPDFIRNASRVFGSQCVVVGIDVQRRGNGDYEVVVDHGREPTGLHPVEWATVVCDLHAGEIYLTSIDRDGSKEGYDLALMRQVTDSVDIPVIAFGGVGKWAHLIEGITEGGADAVAAANIFHYTDYSAKKAKDVLRKAGIDVR